MELTLEKLLLSELRIAVYKKNEDTSYELTDEAMTAVVTVNEELGQLGYTLRPQDLAALAKSPSLSDFPQHFRSLLQFVEAEPMYPDFPRQVMAMDEAEFRFHQLMHYFSTYGVEDLLGVEVSRGWMPDMDKTEKTKQDEILLDAKVIELLPEEEAPLVAAKRVLSRRNRLNDPDREIVTLAIPLLTPEDLGGIKVPFKENLTELFEAILKSSSGDRGLRLWRQMCSHTGDVIKCVRGILPRHDYHFRTSQKKAIVRLLESYPADDFSANLILSRGKREKSLEVLQFVDYNMYSRSADHKEAVRALRNGELRSWEAQAKYLLSSGDEGALDFIAARPGMMLRMLNWLLNLGYTADELTDRLVLQAGRMSPNTMLRVINAMELKDRLAPDEAVYQEKRSKISIDAKHAREYCESKHSQLQADHEMRIMIRKFDRWYNKQLSLIIEDRSCGWLERMRKRSSLRKVRNNYMRELEGHRKRMTDPEHVEMLIRNINGREKKQLRELDESYRSDVSRYSRDSANTETIRSIMKTLLAKHLEEKETVIRGRKVYLDSGTYDLRASRMTAGEKTDDGGYLPDGMAVRIPDEVNYLRFFFYWNYRSRVDVDLHVTAADLDGNKIHIGWDGEYTERGITHSGDITTSDAAEYIDIDMSAPVSCAFTDIHLYDGKTGFGAIETCFVGLMAVDSNAEDIALYNPANCIFTHELRSNDTFIHYGKIDVQGRRMYHGGKSPEKWTEFSKADVSGIEHETSFTVEDYVDMLMRSQGAEIAASPDDAEVILTIDKSSDEKAVSLCDHNFFLEA